MEMVKRMVSARPLVIFTKSTCSMTHADITLFRDFGANPTIHELDRIPRGGEIERALRSLGYKTVPVVFIGGELAGGPDEITSLHLQGKLVPWLMRAGVIWIAPGPAH